MFTNIHYFFTTWVVILVIFHKYTHKYLDLLYLTFVTCLIGLYISYIHPQKYDFILNYKNYTIKSLDKFILVDLLFHIIAFLFIFAKYNHKFELNIPFLNSICIILLYSISMNLYQVYGIRQFELLTVMVIANLLYIILFE